MKGWGWIHGLRHVFLQHELGLLYMAEWMQMFQNLLQQHMVPSLHSSPRSVHAEQHSMSHSKTGKEDPWNWKNWTKDMACPKSWSQPNRERLESPWRQSYDQGTTVTFNSVLFFCLFYALLTNVMMVTTINKPLSKLGIASFSISEQTYKVRRE